MSFILPVLTGVVLFGSTFHLRKYELRPFQIYDNSAISQYIQVTNISSFKSKFFVVETLSECRKALGVDVATGLKALVDDFPYQFSNQLNSLWSSGNYVRVILQLSIRTVKESLPYNVPTIGDWKTKGQERVGSHYVKSIVYGADSFAILSIIGQSQQHKNKILETISSRLGKNGVFDSSFKEKLDSVLEEYGTKYEMSSFGTLPIDKNVPPSNIEDMLALKDNIQEIVGAASNNKGFKLFYEMQSLSFLDPEFLLVEINREITKVLDLVELKYEDLVVADEEYMTWVTDATHRFTLEEEKQIEAFDVALNNARTAMEGAIGNMDITTSGNTDQFEDAMKAYGARSSHRKYRDWFKQLKQDIQSSNHYLDLV